MVIFICESLHVQSKKERKNISIFPPLNDSNRNSEWNKSFFYFIILTALL